MDIPLKIALQSVTPEVYQNMKRAVELGKWPSGLPLSERQRAYALQLMIGYESLHLPLEQRSGYIPVSSCKTQASDDQHAFAPVRFDPT